MNPKEILSIQQKIIPEMIELMNKRYVILKRIYFNQPIGRRTLSQDLNLGERIVRKEVNFLKEQGLVKINSTGMIVTKEGEDIIENLQPMIHDINGLTYLEEKLENCLNFSKVIIVPGNEDEDKSVQKEMGKVTANYVKGCITIGSTIALTGGTSVEQFVDNFPKINKKDVLVIPARGGIGRRVETQANTLAAKLAFKMGANYKLLHVPDSLSNEALETMANEPDIKDTLKKICKSDILIFGIGRADDMSRRRGLPDEELNKIKNSGAVSEAFGHYFDKDGNVVFKTPTIGVNFEDLKNIKHIIAIAGGKNKAEALIATKIASKSAVLVTDEGAAREIIKIKYSGDSVL